MKPYKNIVFDLGGVVFMRDPKKCSEEFIDFFSFVRGEVMPHFWNEYDRGTLSKEETIGHLVQRSGFDRAKCSALVDEAIAKQEAVKPTEQLIEALKAGGYRLYVLSNMSREFIDFLRAVPVYRHFEGEVVSCEEGVCKPEQEIYQLLLKRYGLNPAETLFIDDRHENLEGAAREGIAGFLFNRNNPTQSCDRLREQLL
ncbi:MAG: HAD family phosphatase [Alistipes sp.]|nr:HAD family phosphatase [Alistipes sp.]